MNTQLTPELERYYEARADMMTCEGWKDLMVDMQNMRASVNTLHGVTPDTLRFKQGELSIINWLLGLEEASEQAYRELKEDDA